MESEVSWARFGMGCRAVSWGLGRGMGGLLCPRLMTGMLGGRGAEEDGVRGGLTGAGSEPGRSRGGEEDGEPTPAPWLAVPGAMGSGAGWWWLWVGVGVGVWEGVGSAAGLFWAVAPWVLASVDEGLLVLGDAV